MKTDANFFRYPFALFDILVLNLISFVVITFLPKVEFTNHIAIFLFFNNLTWLLGSYFTALYLERFTKINRFLRRTMQCYAIYFVIIQSFVFFTGYDYSRLFILFNLTLFFLVLFVSRVLIVGGQHYLASHPRFNKKVIMLGFNDTGSMLSEHFARTSPNTSIEGYFDDQLPAGGAILGRIDQVLDYVHLHGIDEIYSTISPEKDPAIHNIALKAEAAFVRFKFVPDFRMFVDRRIHIEFAKEIPIVSLRSEPLEQLGNRIRKFCFDVVFSFLVTVLILSWLIPILAIIIKLDSRGPVFFKQLRSGKNNIPFLCFKFRSLHVNNESDEVQVRKGDSRYTRVGKILRKTNLDELPQFFNVLRGDMSVVGPRPHMLRHTEDYSRIIGKYMIRHYVKPGITGLAQINGFRGEITHTDELEGRVEHDIRYLENWSMWYDFSIIVLTVYKTIVGDKKAF